MPLFMDFHVIPDLTIEQVRKAHMADLAVQDKYDIKYHQFWVNEKAGTLFCLIEGPDKESCAAVHREAHGGIACQIVEVESGLYNLVMGESHRLDHFGMVLNKDGSVDDGYRFVLVLDIIGKTSVTSSVDYKDLVLPLKSRKLALNLMSKHRGKKVNYPGQDSLVSVFTEPKKALQCAVNIHQQLKERKEQSSDPEWDIRFKISLSGGQPVTENEEFFQTVINLGQRLNLISEDQQIVLSTLAGELSEIHDYSHLPFLRVISPGEEKFLNHLFDITENHFTESDFNVKSLSRDIGMSRPQLYRKITSITGRSPNKFIRALRMKKALSMIRQQRQNISEIALEVGFSNPAYFTKCFQQQFGITPSKIEVTSL